jgi:hypothetical protein
METIVKKIQIYIPINEKIPDILTELTPEETLLCINIGCDSITKAKSGVNILSHEEIYNNIRQDMIASHQSEVMELHNKINKMEIDIKIQEELYKTYMLQEEDKIEQQLSKRLLLQKENFDFLQSSHTKEREHMRDQVLHLEKELLKYREYNRDHEKEINHKIHEEAMKIVNRELEIMKTIIDEKEKQNENYKAAFEKAMEKIDSATQKKSVVSIGKIGEHQFGDIAMNAFRDFEGFEFIDVHSVGGQGDFHLKFKDFSVLADSKLYSNKVNSTSREKIKRDLKKNEHIHFAWLVSLDTTIDKFDKAPFMFEWITENKCICYINSLLKYEEPSEMLRAVWYACKTLYGIMINEEMGANELNKLRQQELKIKEITQKMIKNNRERETIMTQIRSNFEKNDEYVRELLNTETNQLIDKYFASVVEWWNSKLEEYPGEKMKSTNIWTQFKRDNENVDMDCNTFKEIICSFLTENRISKPKNKAGAIEILNIRWKNLDQKSNIPVEKPKIKINTLTEKNTIGNFLIHNTVV